MENGWVRLYRCLLDKAVWKCSNPEQRCVLITLLLMANHEPKQWVWQGNKYKVGAGQLITSLNNISLKAGVSIQSVRSAIQKFEKLEFLTNKSTKTGRLITILNWELYQPKKEETDKETDKDPTNTQQTTDKGSTTNNNDNNDNNVNNGNNIIPPISPKGKAKKVNLEQQFKDMVNDTELSEPLKNKLIEWIDYKVEIKKPYRSETGFKTFLKKIGEFTLKYTDAEIIEVIDTSMSNGYQGVIWDKISKPSNNNSAYMDAIKNRVNVVDTWL